MEGNDRQGLVKEIVEENNYLCLSTTDGQEPWVAPVQYLHDSDYNFYFFSLESARHVSHIRKNEVVSFAIFDSQQPPLTGKGIQVKGKAHRLSEDEYPGVVTSAIEEIQMDMSSYMVFKIKPLRFYVVEAYVKGGYGENGGRDKRLEVEMDL